MLIKSLPQESRVVTLKNVKSHKENLLNVLHEFRNWLKDIDSFELNVKFPKGRKNDFVLYNGLCANIGCINLNRGISKCGGFIETIDYRIQLHTIFDLWPKFSGSSSYPVPSCNDTIGMPMFGPKAYESLRGGLFYSMYDTSEEYGALRVELFDFIIECVEKDFGKFVRIDSFSY